MAITVTFDIAAKDNEKLSHDRERLNICFTRFGWESLGGTTWRYPALDQTGGPDDWFNHIIPALMYFRSLVIQKGIPLSKFTITAHSEAVYRAPSPDGPTFGQPFQSADDIHMFPDKRKHADHDLSESRLRRFVEACAASLG